MSEYDQSQIESQKNIWLKVEAVYCGPLIENVGLYFREDSKMLLQTRVTHVTYKHVHVYTNNLFCASFALIPKDYRVLAHRNRGSIEVQQDQ